MLFATQPVLFINHLDMTLFLRLNDADHSRLSYLELRHHWSQVDLALQVQFNDGRTLSQYGLYPDCAWCRPLSATSSAESPPRTTTT